MDRATLLLQSIVGGEAGPIVEQVSADHLPTESQVSLRKARLEALLAYKIDDAQILDILTRLGLTLVASDEASWTFSAPSWRFDMAIEADLISIMNLHEKSLMGILGQSYEQQIITNEAQVPVLVINPIETRVIRGSVFAQ